MDICEHFECDFIVLCDENCDKCNKSCCMCFGYQSMNDSNTIFDCVYKKYNHKETGADADDVE